MRRVALAAALLALGAAPAAQADAIAIDFDFSWSSVSALGFINIPPAGSLSTAFARLTLPGAGVNTPSPGVGTFSDLSLQATIRTNILGNAIDGFVTASQVGGAAASVQPGFASVVVARPAFVSLVASVDCQGAFCGVAGIPFPFTLTGIQSLPLTFTFMALGLQGPGPALLTGRVSLTFQGNEIELNLVGIEIARSFVAMPEPSTALLAGAGLAGLGAARRLRRGRSRSASDAGRGSETAERAARRSHAKAGGPGSARAGTR